MTTLYIFLLLFYIVFSYIIMGIGLALYENKENASLTVFVCIFILSPLFVTFEIIKRILRMFIKLLK